MKYNDISLFIQYIPLMLGFYMYHINIISRIRNRYNENFINIVNKISDIDKKIGDIAYEINKRK